MIHVRVQTWLWTACLLVALVAAGAATAQTITEAYVPDEIIIKFKPHATEAQKAAILADIGAHDVKEFKRIKAKHGKIAGLSVGNAIGRYKNHPAVSYIEPNYIIVANETPNDPRFTDLWGMENTGQTGGTPGADISATNAWDIFTGSSDVLVGVIDTGVDYNHPDLADNIWTNPGEIPGNGIDDDANGYVDDVHGWDFYNDDNDPMDDNGHGSHCSGTIGGVGNNAIGVAGVSWDVSIMALKFLSAGGSGSTDDAIACIEYATMMGVDLTSNSWGGGGYSAALEQAIADAGAANILFIAAAGNSRTNTDTNPHYPSSYTLDNIISVAATDHDDLLADEPTWGSNWGPVSVDLAAPGVAILSTTPGNNYSTYSGTSMATPHVAGTAALIKGRFPAIGAPEIKSLILNMADPLPALDGMVLTGARLNAFMTIADPDSTPPAPITDLTVAGAGSNWLDVQWSAVGDDGMTGQASRYDLRVATFPIDAANFETATPVNGTPDPGMPGTVENMRVDGLDFTTTYYVAIKAQDEFGNAGDLSNVPMGTTLGAPTLAVNPLSLSDALLTGGTSRQTLTLSNVGAGTLDFILPTPILLGGTPSVKGLVILGKGEPDTRVGFPVVDDSGGPDAFGYRWVDSDDPLGPTYAWTDISDIGSVAMSTGDDVSSGPFAISFPFSFYGAEHSQFYVCSNGFLSFTDNSTAYGNQQLPNAGAPGNLVAPFWDDLTVGAGTVYYYDDGTQLIVQWEGVEHYGGGGPYSFQAILSADGNIVFQYGPMGAPDDNATLGIQNHDGSDGLEIAFNTPYVADGLAVRMYAVPQWLSVSPSEGTVWSGGNMLIDVDFDATGLIGGLYDGIIRVVSNDPANPDYEVPVQLDVTGAPDLSVSPTYHDFGNLFLGATATTEVMVRNIGTDALTVSSIVLSDPAFTADHSSFTLVPGQTQPVTVTFAPTAAQGYAATMTVTSDDPTDPVAIVDLVGVGQEPPDFSVTPTSLASALYTGETESQDLTLSNSGGADFEYNLRIDFHSEVTVHDFVDIPKGDVDARVGNPVIAGSGGPDVYGYRWIDSNEPGGPAYNWVDISTTGTPMFSGTADDTNEGPFPIGFDFGFYGNTFDQFNVCSNGFVSFTSTSTTYSNQELPNSGAPENLLAVFWDDLRIVTSTGANVFYEYDGTRLIVQFHRVPAYYATGEHTFQVILYPDGTILYQYETMDSTDLQLCTVGIQNEARDDGLTVAFNTPYVADGLAVRFQAFPEWLTVSPSSGTVAPGMSEIVTANFNANGLFGGTYEADIVIESNDPSAPEFPVPVVLDVTGAPDLLVSATAFDFGTNFVGTPSLQNISIVNIGTDDLVITAVTIDNADFNTSVVAPITLGPTESLLETVGFLPSAPGAQTGTLTLTSNDPDQPTLVIDLAGEGILPPEAGVTPSSLVSDLLTGQTETQNLTLSNTGDSDLTFEVLTLLGATDVVVYDTPDLGKEEPDLNPGILGSGGPDLYGYRWKDSNEPGGPLFEWTDISATGTPVFSGVADDRNEGPFPVGFTFPFYGTPFTTFNVCSNGWISFTSTSTDLSNSALPGTGSPENLLAIFHDDLRPDTGTGSNVYYENVGNKLIVQYDQVPRYSSGGPYTFQAHLYPNGTIMYYYLSMAGTRLDEATIGIQNATRDDGLTVVYNDDYVEDNLAIRLAPVSDWLTVSPAAGVVTPGGSENLAVTFNAAELFGGVYDGAVRITSNDPVNSLLEVPATLTVTGVPVAAADPTSLDFGDVFIGYPAELQLTVSNAGTDLLTVTDIVAGSTEYTVTPTAFDLDPFESETVTVTFVPNAEGDRASELEIMSNDVASPLVVPLAGNGLVPPVVAWSPAELVGAALPGGTKTKTLEVCNTGGSDLTWSLSEQQDEITTTQVYDYLEVEKETEDPRPGILGSGGPDAFGYTWVDSDDPGGPTFDWVDITTIGTPIFGRYSDDGNEGPLPIGFTFPFYGNDFTEFNVCSNGFMSFTSTSTAYTNQPLPNAGAPENLLAAYWDDMVVDAITRGLDIYYHNDGTRLIVQYQIRRIATFDPPWYDFQTILYPDGTIVYQYNTLGTNQNSATIGIQNATQDDGLMMVFNDTYVHEGLAIRISSAPDWLSVPVSSGVIAAGECVSVDVVMDATELEAGDYTGSVTLVSNDPVQGTVAIPVTFHVGSIDAAAADVDPNTLNLSSNGKWMTGYVELPEGYDPADVLVETVLFNGMVAADTRVYSLAEDFNGNGIPDMMFKFDRTELEGILEEGEAVEVVLTGEVRDTTYFVARDTIRVIQPTLMSPSGETIVASTDVTIQWETPAELNVDNAALVYTIDGVEWHLIAEGITGTSHVWNVPEVMAEEARVRVFVFDNQGMIGFDTCDEPIEIVSSISGVDENDLPTVYALKSAYPNPFNPRTKIAFDLPRPGRTKIQIYDIRGRRVSMLLDEHMVAGTHSVDWFGKDDNGRQMASGVYFYQIQSGGFTATNRMTLLK